MRRFLLVALILPVLFGCASSAAQARQTGTTVNLVAYSTPKPVMGKLITRFQHQPAGQGVSFTQSYGPSGSQAQGDRRRAAGRHRVPLDRARHRHGRRRRSRREELDEDALRRDRGQLGRRLRRAAGQPEAHPRLEGPDQAGSAGRDAGSVPLRLGEVERPRRLRCGAQVGDERHARPCKFVTKLFKHVVSQDSSGSNAASDVLLRQGRRPDHLRERGVHRLRRRPAGQARRPQADDADPAADGGDEEAHPRRPRRSSSTCTRRSSRRSSPPTATARS